MASPPVEIQTVAQALSDRFGAVEGVAKSLPYEPLKAPRMPLVSVMFEGFKRRQLESAEVDGPRLHDPLGGRIWVYTFAVRIWVKLASDEAKAQSVMMDLAKKIPLALEADASLGSLAVDSAMAQGNVTIVEPAKGKGQPFLMLNCATAVEVEESATPTP